MGIRFDRKYQAWIAYLPPHGHHFIPRKPELHNVPQTFASAAEAQVALEQALEGTLEPEQNTYFVEWCKTAGLNADEENARGTGDTGLWLAYGPVKARSKRLALLQVANDTGCLTRIAGSE